MIPAISSALISIVAILGVLLTRKKSREDTVTTNFSLAISAWKDLAESHKKHWDSCELQVLELREELTKTTQTVYKLERIIRNKGRIEEFKDDPGDER
jgi:hypothetical protein